ncbi:MAG: hypothetical protein IJF31_03475, partial [Clostridia bacterium]|nr:hypothetical protein [Clostridia bacterium]
GQYSVYGTSSPRPYDTHPSIDAAIEAENNSLLRAYARETDHTVTWVKRQLQDNPDFLKAWGKKRLLEKMPKGYVSRSRNVSETVTLSKGELAKLHANYAGEKVFARQSVVEAVKKIDAFAKLTGKQRNAFINRLWKGYNERLHQQGFDMFTDNFNRLYNLNIGSNANNPITVRTALGQSTKFTQEMVKYFKELKQDVEGISKKRSQEKAYNDAVAFIRSSYATFQLGANPKVWVTQL